MAIDPNTGINQAAQQNPTEPTLTEQQIRTMRGDLTAPAAVPTATMPTPESQIAIPQTAPAPSTNTTKIIFDSDEPAFSPNTTVEMAPASSVDTLMAQEGGKKMLWWIIGGVVTLAALGAVSYFVVYPMLNAESEEPAPIAEAPVTPEPPTPPVQPSIPVRLSSFINKPNNEAALTVDSPLSRTTILVAMNKAMQGAQMGVTELIIKNSTSSTIPFGTFFSALATGFTEVAKTNLLFADEFTAFIFKDDKGVWPGYIATLRPGFNDQALKSWFTSLEKSPLKNFFVSDPGKMSAFKDGMINEKYPDRYSTGAAAGASLGYAMLPTQQKVLISTSFAGLKEALRLMGL